MPLHLNKLTALFIQRQLPAGYYGDGGGLVLQVTAAGAKSWLFRYTFGGRRHEMGLGSLTCVGLAAARDKARSNRLLLAERRSPLAEKRATVAAEKMQRRQQMTFDECARAYIAAHRSGWKNAKHATQWETTLATYASPLIGALPVAEVDTEMVVSVLSPIWASKTETATRLRGRIESILGWATVSELREGENPARWRNHLDNLLAEPRKIAKVVNHPALPWREVPAFMCELRDSVGHGARAVEFTILTACRSGEVRMADWREVDLAAKLWTIPAERMKAGKEHRVPLSSQALALLDAIPERTGYLFPGKRKKAPLSDMSLTAVLRRLGRGDITIHGFRSSFRDWSSEAEGNAFPREVCEHALAHSLPDRVEAAYRRGDLLEKRVLLMQAWADYCCLQLAGR